MNCCDDFFEVVEKMRKAQKEYFKTRVPSTLLEAKRLEKAVDKALQKKQKADSDIMQKSLFD